jgi:hypothetical protein
MFIFWQLIELIIKRQEGKAPDVENLAVLDCT